MNCIGQFLLGNVIFNNSISGCAVYSYVGWEMYCSSEFYLSLHAFPPK